MAQLAARIFEHYGFNLVAPTRDFCSFFDTITVTECDAPKLKQFFLQHEMNIAILNDKEVSLSFSELSKREDLIEISRVLSAFTHEPELVVDNMEENAA